MDRLLAGLERRFGRFAVERLSVVIVGGMAVVFLLSMALPGFQHRLTLDIDRVMAGEVWRLVTYLFLPTSNSMFWILFSLYITYLIGTNLEHEWGAFKFNVFYLLGMVGTTLAAFLTGGAEGNFYLNTSLFLAFATVFPQYEFYLFFVLPIRVKWLGFLSGALLAYAFALGSWSTRGAIAAAMINYLLFFGGHLAGVLRGKRLEGAQAARRTSMRPPTTTSTRPPDRVCAICGASQDDGADIRVCSCEKCGGVPRNLCLPHARNH